MHLSCSSLFVIGLFVSLSGCQPKYAEAYLKVDRDKFKDRDHYIMYKETQATLLKSDHILMRAEVDREFVSRYLEAIVQEDELIHVRLPVRGKETAKSTEETLDRVLEAYISEVVSTARMEKVEELSRLRKAYAQCLQEIQKNAEDIMSLERKHGPFPDESARPFLYALEQEHLDSLRELSAGLVLDLTELTSDAGYREAQDPAKNAILEGRYSAATSRSLARVKKLISEREEKLLELGAAKRPAALEVREATLEGLKQKLGRIIEEKRLLELAVEDSRVRVIQHAYVNPEK